MGFSTGLKANWHLTTGPSDLRFWKSQIPLLSIFAGLLVFTSIAAASFVSINSLEARARWVEHTHRVLFTLEETFSLLKDVRSSARGFVISGNPNFLKSFQLYTNDVRRKVDSLRVLSSDNAEQQRNVDILKSRVAEYVEHAEAGVSMRRKNANSLAIQDHLTADGDQRAMDRVRTQIDMMQDREGKLLEERSRAVGVTTVETKTLIVFGTAGVYLMIGGALWLLVREVRQRRRAEYALLEANETLLRHAAQLESSNKELESFSYSISHDLRIPLRAVSGYARMMEEDYAGEIDHEGRRLLKVIRDNSKRMGDLIDDLLAFSRLGRAEISAAEVDMAELVTAAIEDARRKEDYPAARVEVASLPQAWGDRALLQQVWINLISNAFKYSSSKEQPIIKIDAVIEDNQIIYRICDNGVGFDMQYYDKLFGVFQRLHSMDEFPGTGVGLAIVQRIVMRHGGRVWAQGKIDHGAAFFFSLPLTRTIRA